MRTQTSTTGAPLSLTDLASRKGAVGGLGSSGGNNGSSNNGSSNNNNNKDINIINTTSSSTSTTKKTPVTLLAEQTSDEYTRQRSASIESETTWLTRHRSKGVKKHSPAAHSSPALVDDDPLQRPPPLPPAASSRRSSREFQSMPLPPTPSEPPGDAAARLPLPADKRKKKRSPDVPSPAASPAPSDVAKSSSSSPDAVPLKRTSSHGDLLPFAAVVGAQSAAAAAAARSRAESDHVPPVDVVAVSRDDKRQFLDDFLSSRPPASQIPALARAAADTSSSSLSSSTKRKLVRVEGGPLSPLSQASSPASGAGGGGVAPAAAGGEPLTVSSLYDRYEKSPRKPASPPPMPPPPPVPRSGGTGSPRPSFDDGKQGAGVAGVSITRITDFQRNPDAVRAMLAAAGVDPNSIGKSKVAAGDAAGASKAPERPSGGGPDAAGEGGLRRLRSITYVRTQAIEAPILKILQSGRFTIDVPRFERLMADEVVYVVQITSLVGGDLGPAGWNWLVRHKFTAFANLHVILKGLRIVRDMPKFPRKIFVLYLSEAMLEKRCQKLAEYLTALAKTPIGRTSTFIDFLRPTKSSAYNVGTAGEPDDDGAMPMPTPMPRPSSPPPPRATSPMPRAGSPALPASPAPHVSPSKAAGLTAPKPKGAAPPAPAAPRAKKDKDGAKQPLSSSGKAAPGGAAAAAAAVATAALPRAGSSGGSGNPVRTELFAPSPLSGSPAAAAAAAVVVSSSSSSASTAAPATTGNNSNSDREEDQSDDVGVESGSVDARLDLKSAVREANELRRSAAQRPETLSLDDFEILKLIGVGGFGKVFLCKKRSTGEILALKRLRKKLIEAKGQGAHVRTEKEVLEFTRALGNDSWLTRLFYSFETPEYLCLAMEYVPGGDLRIILDDFGTLEDENARFYFCEMVMCVYALHKLGYIHRDLKPANFLIDADGHLKLGDFGLSKGAEANPRASVVVTRRLKAYSVVGTPQYMAKETLTGGGYDASVDWWALGCMLYEMLVGEPPFDGETADEIFDQVRNFGDSFQKSIASSSGKADSPLSPGAGQVVLRLICDTSVRLGDEQVDDIKALPWFEGVDWNNLRQAEPPFIPQLESAEDTTYFAGATDRAERDPDKSLDLRRRTGADEDADD
jgi:serine/threonine protein kinase